MSINWIAHRHQRDTIQIQNAYRQATRCMLLSWWVEAASGLPSSRPVHARAHRQSSSRRWSNRLESNRKMALSETSRSQQQLSISSEYQRQAPFHTRPGSISNAFNAITKVESATPSNANGYNPSIRHCSCASRSSLPQNAGSVCVWNCDTSGKKHRVWPSTMACANSSFPRVEDRSGRFSGSGRR